MQGRPYCIFFRVFGLLRLPCRHATPSCRRGVGRTNAMCGARLFCAPPCDIPTLHALRLLFALPVAPVRRRHSTPSRIIPKYPFGVGTTAFPHTPRHPFRTREARLCALSLPFFSALYCRLASTLSLASTPFSIISAGHAPFPGALSVRHSVASDSSSSLPLSPMPPPCVAFVNIPVTRIRLHNSAFWRFSPPPSRAYTSASFSPASDPCSHPSRFRRASGRPLPCRSCQL